jgi:hypothetical protein
MAPDSDEPFGIRVLKWLCLFACLSALADLALSPIFAAIFAAFRLRDALPENHTQRAISIVIGLRMRLCTMESAEDWRALGNSAGCF